MADTKKDRPVCIHCGELERAHCRECGACPETHAYYCSKDGE